MKLVENDIRNDVLYKFSCEFIDRVVGKNVWNELFYKVGIPFTIVDYERR